MTAPSPPSTTGPAISLPKGGGAIRGIGEKFGANLVTGTGSMTIPIATSPGRSDVGPQLTLAYDSGHGNGPFGFGWSLSLPSVTRKTDQGLPQYRDDDESDVFILSGSEDLVPAFRLGESVIDDSERVVDGVTYRVRCYRPRVETSFARLERWTRREDGRAHWRSLSADNVLTIYGRTQDSQIADPGDPTRVFSWLICETRDDRGNGIVYEYKSEDGTGADLAAAHQSNRGVGDDPGRRANRYLKRIRYGNRSTLLDGSGQRPSLVQPAALANADWMFEVVFDYGEHDVAAPKPGDTGDWAHRADAFSTYRPGFELRTARRCRRVLMFHHFDGEPGVGRDCLVRSTDFVYSDQQSSPDPQRAVYSFLQSVEQAGYRRRAAGYERRNLPLLAFEYSPAVVHDEVADVDRASLENLPTGLDGATYQWIDLHGEGSPGILTEQAGGWFYKRNLSPASTRPVEFAPTEIVSTRPQAVLAGGGAQILDLAGDGLPDVVMFRGVAPGLYEHDEAEGWQSFRAFGHVVNHDMRDQNLRFVDLDGDGRADVLITEGDALVWHPSLGEDGFGPARRVGVALDEEHGPRVVFTSAAEWVVLADLSGDGLSDLVRIRNGEVCYWPNLGYGRFGAKITMDNAPWFDRTEHFDSKNLRIADIDGSGTTDLIYLHGDGPRLYFNESGNSWTAPQQLHSFPHLDDVVSVVMLDLLGNGTACLVWSSSLPGDLARPMRYVSLMGDVKPHLLVSVTNNLGAETRVHYAPSTKFYLDDKVAGSPWITRLPFPVHVVDRVETLDHVGRNRFVTRYAYHHGFFDGEEREFRGFAMVEQWDTEQFAALADGELPGENIAAESHVAPVHTKTWFHTGLYLGRAHVSNYFAGLLGPTDKGEYFREPGMTDDDARARLLDDTVLPTDLSPDEEREACRALKGVMLRQEVYADDAGPTSTAAEVERALVPYTVVEQNFTIRTLQRRGGNQHAVFLAHARETITYNYERNPVDPRVQHALTLEADDFGNVLKQASVAYGRQESALATQWDRDRQTTSLVIYTEHAVTNAVESPAAHRNPLKSESRTFELTGYEPSGDAGRFAPADLVEPDPATPARLRHRFADEVAFEAIVTNGTCRRPIEWSRTLYRRDDLSGILPLGELQSLALPGETYALAFTAGLLAQFFVRPHAGEPAEVLVADPNAVLGGTGGDRGGYVSSEVLEADGRFPPSDADVAWWRPSGRSFFGPAGGDPASERAEAVTHFFLTRRHQDQFGHDLLVDFDAHDLLMVETRDVLGNRVRADENDYRVLQPRLVSDPNRNQTVVVFDTLGMMVGTALMGKPAPATIEGDSLDGFVADPTPPELDAFFGAADPRPSALALLRDASVRVVYDLHRFRRSRQANPSDPTKWEPVGVATITRETHVSVTLPPHGLRAQISFSYSDGFGRVVQNKLPAEPGPIVDDGPIMSPRWVASGWTISNNKGKPVRQYEPFFSASHHFEFGVRAGVSPVLFYDPIERVVATLHPNHTYEKVVFDPWQQTSYDVNDTCAPSPVPQGDLRPAQTGDPRTDPDIGGLVAAYFATQDDSWQTWHTQRTSGALGTEQQDAARRAEAHADTPLTSHFDVMGRPFLNVARNRVVCAGHDLDGTEENYVTRVELDIEGNQLEVRDELNVPVDFLPTGPREQRVVMRYAYNVLGTRIHQVSFEAGARWMLDDVAGLPVRAWDSRGHRVATTYDALRRQVGQTVRGTRPDSDPRTLNRDILVERIEYGETEATASPVEVERAHRLNVRTRILRHSDAAGVVTNARLDVNGDPIEAYDFRGNLLCSTRRLVTDSASIPDWLQGPQLDVETFEGSNRYDALNRVIQAVAPHSSLPRSTRNVVQASFNETGLLDRVDVWLDRDTEPTGLLDPSGEPPAAVGVSNIDYDAKGQRRRIDYKNGASTFSEYDPDTFRLVELVTRRSAAAFPGDAPRHLQNLRYTHDPAGNITRIHDDAQQSIFFSNRRVDPSNDYTYDACYRVIQATGREQLVQAGVPIAHSHNDAGRVGMLGPNDGNAMGAYTERYVYDGACNMLRMQHRGTDPANPGWTRRYRYEESSLIETTQRSNRLSGTQVGNGVAAPSEVHQHDAHGNMLRLPHLGNGQPGPNMQWDHRDQLCQADLGGGGTVFFVYDAAGQRVRKVWEKSPGLTEERIYLGGFELFRRHNGAIGADTAVLERETLHVMDDEQRVAMVEARTLDTGGGDPSPQQLIRYQLGNHLGSASLELDQQGQVISYEEYSPYGSSTYQAVRSQTETAKRYQFTGKERDEETGATYHGARYYLPWLGRWLSTDPLWRSRGASSSAVGKTDSKPSDLNLYDYANGRVTYFVDLTGLSPTQKTVTTVEQWKEIFDKKLMVKGKMYDRGGTTVGDAAKATLWDYGETTGLTVSQSPTGKTNWMFEPNADVPTGESKRYIYTTKGGWIDMVHFMFYAGRGLTNLKRFRDEVDTLKNRVNIYIMNKMSSPKDQIDYEKWREEMARIMAMEEVKAEGRFQEALDGKASAYSYEDLPSDTFGGDFAINYFDPKSSKTLSEQMQDYLRKLGATDPEKAPNWAKVPKEYIDYDAPRNHSDKPMFTTP